MKHVPNSPEPADAATDAAATPVSTRFTPPNAPVLSKVEGRHACPEQSLSRACRGGRRDGWIGEKMAKFCEVLAETAVVAEACDQAGMGISGAYVRRRRNPILARAARVHARCWCELW